jgi:hypothetical protein
MKLGATPRRHPHSRVATPAAARAGSNAAVYATLSTRIPRRLYRGLRIACVEANRSVQDFVTDAMREALRRRKHTPNLRARSPR